MPKRVEPHVSTEVVEWLEDLYPDHLPAMVKAHADEYAYLIGQQSVIRKLRATLEYQERQLKPQGG